MAECIWRWPGPRMHFEICKPINTKNNLVHHVKRWFPLPNSINQLLSLPRYKSCYELFDSFIWFDRIVKTEKVQKLTSYLLCCNGCCLDQSCVVQCLLFLSLFCSNWWEHKSVQQRAPMFWLPGTKPKGKKVSHMKWKNDSSVLVFEYLFTTTAPNGSTFTRSKSESTVCTESIRSVFPFSSYRIMRQENK